MDTGHGIGCSSNLDGSAKAMVHFARLIGLALLMSLLGTPFTPSARGAVIVGQVDTFEDGTTQGWTAGGTLAAPVVPPANVTTGGPAGVDDNYLRISAIGGSGPGSKLAAFNLSQWTGNYTAAGVSVIQMNVSNFGPDDAYVRLLFSDPAGGPPTNLAITSAAFLPAGSGWTPVTFAVDPASLITLLGSAASALANVTELRIFHNPAATFPGPPEGPPAAVLQLGVDDVAAVPEPFTPSLAGAGLVVLALRRPRRSAKDRARGARGGADSTGHAHEKE
jgi:hypothetical protein